MKNSRGYVLVIVLIAVLLCATLTIILFERGRVSLQSSSAFSRAAQVRALSEMAVNRVQSQIRDATTLNQTLSTPLNKRDTWASQPGAIRVYGPDGKLRSIYKLYSSDTMVTDDPDLAGDVPANWYERPAEFVDLNEPVRNGDRERYPIVDPNVASHMSGASGLVDGFSIRSDAPIEPGNPLANRAPMPVRWIYVLEDGTLCGLGDSRIDRETNPIIGRIAFWTDDETLKVNINTASPVTPNSYWDSPRAAGNDSAIDPTEFDYSWKQPSQNEYQRYPGHPATVSLLPILGDLGGLSREDYFKISPRYYWGGPRRAPKRSMRPAPPSSPPKATAPMPPSMNCSFVAGRRARKPDSPRSRLKVSVFSSRPAAAPPNSISSVSPGSASGPSTPSTATPGAPRLTV
jgi:uncharacterized protein (TIGR02600 family)